MVLKTKSADKQKMKRPFNKSSKVPVKKRPKISNGLSKLPRDEELLSDSDMEDVNDTQEVQMDNEFDDPNETALEKKMRLTKRYLDQLKKLKDNDESEDEKDFVGEKLKEEVLRRKGKQLRQIADSLNKNHIKSKKFLKGFRKSVVSLAISENSKLLFAASKDCAITKWCLITNKLLVTVKGGKKINTSHNGHILCLALSSDTKFLASGGMDKSIFIWDPETMVKLNSFKGHRGAVTGLVFRRNFNQLFSSSFDRTVKVWDMEAMGYIETLYGHQDAVQACDSFYKDRCLTSGGRDGTLRLWKIQEESQLVYYGHTGSIDCVRFINEGNFISGGDDGTVCLWSIMKKKPTAVIKNAHGSPSRTALPSWISSVASLPNTDVVATGSNDGRLRLWKCNGKFNQLTSICDVDLLGFINDIQFTENGKFLIVALGQEHKLGRWWTCKEAKNAIVILPLQLLD